ncbi:MAG: c-type cytochrome [Usitatibacter sp.]
MKKQAIAALVMAATAITAAAQQMKAENQIKYRRAAYQLMNLNFGSLNAMAEGKKAFDAQEAARNADFVAMLSTVPKQFFGEGTDKDTKAKPEVWTHRADFDAKMDKMTGETAKLPAAVRAGDMAAFRKQVGNVGEACKACHDEYRMK